MGRQQKQKTKRWQIYLVLNVLVMLYSFSTVCSKMAAKEEFLSVRFLVFYGVVIGILGIYAICWQQIIKRMPLSAAYANRAMDIVWGIVYGVIFFREKINIGKICGALFVMAGVILFALADSAEAEKNE